MRKTFVDRVDKSLLVIWEIFLFLCTIILLIFEGMLFFFIKLFFKRGLLRRAGKRISLFFDFINKFLLLLKKYLRTSRKFRRFMSLFAVIISLLFFFPLYEWRTWKFYERGIASYYGWGFYCRAAVSGEIYWPWKYAAAHKELPIGEVIKVVNLDNGRVIYVRIFDRGPFVKGRILDLTRRAAHDLGIIENGTANVEIYVK